MIYIQGLTGRNIYTRLEDVLDVKKPIEHLQHEGFDELGKQVNAKYDTYTQNFMSKQNRTHSKHEVTISTRKK